MKPMRRRKERASIFSDGRLVDEAADRLGEEHHHADRRDDRR
jgi:hypothetical protein